MSTDAANLFRGAAIARGLGRVDEIRWPLKRSDKLFELKYGKALVASSRRPGDVPVYGTNGQTGTHDTALFEGPGVVVGRKGVGHLGVEWVDRDYWVIDTAYSLESVGDVDLKFAYYLILHVGLDHLKHGTSNPSLTREAFGAQLFPVPPIEAQRGIAALLGALDDKIESNRSAVALLEQLVLTEFQRVKATEPVHSIALGEVVDTAKGVSYKSADLQPSRTSLVTLKSFGRTGGYKSDGLKQYVGPYKPKQVIHPGEIVVAQTDLTQGAEVVGRAVRVPAESSADILVASLDLVILRPLSLSLEYLLGVVTDETFREHCRYQASGTTVLHLASTTIPTYRAPIASPESVERYSQFARPLLHKMDSLAREIKQLAALRDAVLPELLSGRIRVPEAEEAAAS